MDHFSTFIDGFTKVASMCASWAMVVASLLTGAALVIVTWLQVRATSAARADANEARVEARRLEEERLAFESRPALIIEIVHNIIKILSEDGGTKLIEIKRPPEKAFAGIRVTNKGKGPAVMHDLLCDGKPFSGLDNAQLAEDVTISYPAKGFIERLISSESKECAVRYSDFRKNLYLQRFRVNLESMVAIPGPCDEIGKAGA